MRKLSLAFSSCPNDTYIFHALTHGLIDCKGLEFEVTIADVEELNKRAANAEFDVCKLSYNAYCGLTDKYKILRSGSALGFNNGPLLVVREDFTNLPLNNSAIIAVPGMHTTAIVLFKSAFINRKFRPMLFSDIENAVLNKEVDAGVLIHEGRFTYKDKGLKLLADLGALWQKKFNLPIPLGGIAIKKKLLSADLSLEQRVTNLIKESLNFANLHPHASKDFITQMAQDMDPAIQKQHIDLFVNDFTLDFGNIGEDAIENLKNEIVRQSKEKL